MSKAETRTSRAARFVEPRRNKRSGELNALTDIQLDIIRNPKSSARDIDKAKARICTINAGLLKKMSHSYAGCGLDLDELHQEAVLGLLKAVDKFDASKGCLFSTYAYLCIRSTLHRAVVQTSKLIGLPFNKTVSLGKLIAARNMLANKGSVGIRDLAEVSGYSLHKVRDLLSLENQIVLSAHYADMLSDTIFDEFDGGDADLDSLDEMLERLQTIERLVISKLYGLDGEVPQSPKRVAEELELTLSELKSIEQTALEMLRSKKYRN